MAGDSIPQLRAAVADFVLHTSAHPSADEAWAQVRSRFPLISRATVFNTLHLFVEKGSLRSYELGGGRAVFDPKVEEVHVAKRGRRQNTDD